MVDATDAICAFENRFTEKGGVPYSPNVCYFMWKGLGCTPKCCQNKKTKCCSQGAAGGLEFDWWKGQQSGVYKPPHRCTDQSFEHHLFPARDWTNGQFVTKKNIAHNESLLALLEGVDLPPDARVCQHMYDAARAQWKSEHDGVNPRTADQFRDGQRQLRSTAATPVLPVSRRYGRGVRLLRLSLLGLRQQPDGYAEYQPAAMPSG